MTRGTNNNNKHPTECFAHKKSSLQPNEGSTNNPQDKLMQLAAKIQECNNNLVTLKNLKLGSNET